MGVGDIILHISKSDFRLFRESPRHIWARKHNRLEDSAADELAAIQGRQVEGLAYEYIQKVLLLQNPGRLLLWQETRRDGAYTARADAILWQAHDNCADLYEIKSSTDVKKEYLEDAAFQALIFQKHFNVEHVFIVLLATSYCFEGALDLERLFKVEDVSEKVNEISADVLGWRAQALDAAGCPEPEALEHCWKPGECPCPELCHPGLPDFSIYDIPRLSVDKKRELEGMGIRAARDIPDSFPLSESQRRIADLARLEEPVEDVASLRRELARLDFPLYFLDYETCNLAAPRYDGYKPYQQVVFQYSLHRLDAPGAEPAHFEHVAFCCGDPTPLLLASLQENIGRQGSVIVWNASFERTRNIEMGRLHPEYAPFLEGVNRRVYDLMEIVSKGVYLHPGFRGSASIKHVLPAIVPELSYAGMEINNGAKASLAWWMLNFGELEEGRRREIEENLKKYCHLDTLAMVEIYRRFAEM